MRESWGGIWYSFQRKRGWSGKEKPRQARPLTRTLSRELQWSTALCSAQPAQLGFLVTRPKLRRMEGCTGKGGKRQTQTSGDNHDSGKGIFSFCWHLSDTNKTCKMQHFLPASSSKAWFFDYSVLVVLTTLTVEVLSTDSRIQIDHWLSSSFIQFCLPEYQIWLHF